MNSDPNSPLAKAHAARIERELLLGMAAEPCAKECPNRPEWAANVPAIQQGKCMWCSRVRNEWVECEAEGE